MSNKLVLQLLVVSAFAGIEINASVNSGGINSGFNGGSVSQPKASISINVPTSTLVYLKDSQGIISKLANLNSFAPTPEYNSDGTPKSFLISLDANVANGPALQITTEYGPAETTGTQIKIFSCKLNNGLISNITSLYQSSANISISLDSKNNLTAQAS